MSTPPLSLPQLTLALFQGSSPDLGDYIAGPNDLALQAIWRWVRGGGPWFIYIYGASATGKSHLLEGALRALDPTTTPAMYLPLATVKSAGPEILANLETVAAIAIDDIHLCAGDPTWETGMFDLYNRLQAAHVRLIVTGSAAPAATGFVLPDLPSRLASGLIFRITELDDEDKRQVIQRRLANRGLNMPDKVARYLLNRVGRDMGDIDRLCERIDTASLSAGRDLTIPFVREVLGLDA